VTLLGAPVIQVIVLPVALAEAASACAALAVKPVASRAAVVMAALVRRRNMSAPFQGE
jgi:hypothetical protein